MKLRLSLTKRERPMFQSFVIVLREGFEAFLIVSIIYAYLKRVGQAWLLPAVNGGIAVSIAASAGLGFVLHRGVNEPLWEGVLGVAAAVMVTTLVIYMWRHGAQMKKELEKGIDRFSWKPSKWLSALGVFAFTVLMITREGMETALLLIQIPQGQIILGVSLGILATATFAWLWVRFSSLINVKLFFQVTGIFLLLFVGQILIYSFHEFTEAELIPNSEFWHMATEPYSPDGLYGKWFSILTILVCSAWLIQAWVRSLINRSIQGLPAK